MTKEYSTLHMHSVHFKNSTYSSVVFILAATFFFLLLSFFYIQNTEEVSGVNDEGVIYRFLMNRGKGRREDALRRTNHSPSS